MDVIAFSSPKEQKAYEKRRRRALGFSLWVVAIAVVAAWFLFDWWNIGSPDLIPDLEMLTPHEILSLCSECVIAVVLIVAVVVIAIGLLMRWSQKDH